MRAVTHPSRGEIALAEFPDPVPGDGEIIVKVRAAGLNRADLLQRDGRYPAPPGWPADIPGLEYAGEVVATGRAVNRWRIGDRVMGLTGGGAQAELLAVHQDEALPIPEGLDFAPAAAIPEAFVTAWDAIVDRGRTGAGERLLIHAIGSGVGTAAAQIGRMIGATVIGTSRTAGKLDRCRALGMSFGVLGSDPRWADLVGGPVDVIIDTLGAAFFADNLRILAERGRLVAVGTITGSRADGLELGRMIRSRLEIIGTAMRSRGHEERAALARRFGAAVLPAFTRGELVPVVDRIAPMSAIDEAHRALRAGETFGKIVLVWD